MGCDACDARDTYKSMKNMEVPFSRNGPWCGSSKWVHIIRSMENLSRFCSIPVSSTTFCLGVTILYQYLSRTNHHRSVKNNSDMELIAITTLWIADKYEGGPRHQEKWKKRYIRDFCMMYEDLKPHHFARFERDILKTLKFRVAMPTIDFFIDHALKQESPKLAFLKDKEFKACVKTYRGSALRSCAILNGRSPSKIAKACIYKAIVDRVNKHVFVDSESFTIADILKITK